MISDMHKGTWFAVIDPHGDLMDEVMVYISVHRRDDVIIFDPSDAEFPFCLNSIASRPDDSKQVLAKWLIDMFKKFFSSNWDSQLKHMLRITFLALLDYPNATLFDIVRALTDKDFCYGLIKHIMPMWFVISEPANLLAGPNNSIPK